MLSPRPAPESLLRVLRVLFLRVPRVRALIQAYLPIAGIVILAYARIHFDVKSGLKMDSGSLRAYGAVQNDDGEAALTSGLCLPT
jgi:hypothetical protein